MKTEKVFSVLILIGLIFKFMHWSGGNILLVLSLSTLAMLYFPLSFYFFSYKGLDNQKYGLSIAAGLVFSTALLGILFKLLYWPGRELMIASGAAGSLIVLAAVFLMSRAQEEESLKKNPAENSPLQGYFRNMKIRTILISLFTCLLFITPISALVNIQHRDDPEMARLKIRSIENPENEDYRKEYLEYLKKKERSF